MRTFSISVLVALLGIAQAAPALERINLDKPGALEAIEKEHPEHYRKIVEIIRVAQAEPCETLPQVLKTRFDAFDTVCKSYQLLTSDPPKRHLSFTLESTGYVTNAIQYNLRGKVVPAKERNAD